MTIRLPALPRGAQSSVIRRILAQSGANTIKLGGGFPQHFDSEGLRASMARALDAGHFGYGVTRGEKPLLEALAAQHGRVPSGARVRPEEVMVLAGSQQGIALAGQSLLSNAADPGQARPKVAMPAVSFLAASGAFRLMGAELVPVKIDEQGVVPASLRKVIDEHQPRFAYVIPDFDNPTGRTLPIERRLELLRIAKETATPLLADNAYSQLWFKSPPPPDLLELSDQVPGSRDHLISLYSLSKIAAPAVRLGWMVAPERVLERAELHRQHLDTCSPAFVQHGMADYLASGRLSKHLDFVRQQYGERMETLSSELEARFGGEMKFAKPQGGMFLFGTLPPTRSGTELAAKAIERDVAIVPGESFHLDGAHNTVRMCVATESPERIKRGVELLASAYGELTPILPRPLAVAAPPRPAVTSAWKACPAL